MNRRLAATVGGVVLVLVALELAAVPIATRVIQRVVAGCVAYETLELTSVARPVLPRLLVGRARDVELRATGLAAGELRVAHARLALPDAVLPWALGDPEPSTAELALRIDEPDLERALREVLPLGLPVEVELQPGVATLGTAVVPLTVDVEVALDPDGTVRLRPVRGGELLERLGIGRSFPPGETARVTAVRIGDGEVSGALALEVVPGVGGGGACDEPIATGGTSSTTGVAVVGG